MPLSLPRPAGTLSYAAAATPGTAASLFLPYAATPLARPVQSYPALSLASALAGSSLLYPDSAAAAQLRTPHSGVYPSIDRLADADALRSRGWGGHGASSTHSAAPNAQPSAAPSVALPSAPPSARSDAQAAPYGAAHAPPAAAVADQGTAPMAPAPLPLPAGRQDASTATPEPPPMERRHAGTAPDEALTQAQLLLDHVAR